VEERLDNAPRSSTGEQLPSSFLSRRLQLMIPVGRASLIQAPSATREFPDGILRFGNGLGRIENRGLLRSGQHHHAIGIASYEITRANADTSDGDRDLYGIDLHAVFAGSHPMRPGEDGIAVLATERNISADAVNYGPTQLAAMRNFGENIAPHRAIFATVIVQYKDVTWGHIVNVVTDRTRWRGGCLISNRKGATRELEMIPAGRDL